MSKLSQPPSRIMITISFAVKSMWPVPEKRIGPLEVRDSCRINTGGSRSENKKVFGDAILAFDDGFIIA